MSDLESDRTNLTINKISINGFLVFQRRGFVVWEQMDMLFLCHLFFSVTFTLEWLQVSETIVVIYTVEASVL